MVDGGASDPVLASHRARGFTVAGADASLLVWLPRAGEFSANDVSEVPSRDTSLLQRDRVHSDGDRDVLSPVSAKGRRDCGVWLLFASRIADGSRCLKRKCHKEARTELSVCASCVFWSLVVAVTRQWT